MRVELAALVVESVRHLVAHHRADAAVVRRHRPPSRRRTAAAGCRREIDVVLERVVVRVHGRRGHQPLGLVDRLADLRQLPGDSKLARCELPRASPRSIFERASSRATCRDSRSCSRPPSASRAPAPWSSAVIHASSPMSRRIAFSIASTIFSVRAFLRSRTPARCMPCRRLAEIAVRVVDAALPPRRAALRAA